MIGLEGVRSREPPKLYGQVSVLRDMLDRVAERGVVYFEPMPPSSDHPAVESNLESEARIAALISELAVAREAAAAAEAEWGRLQGELTKITNHWAACCGAQEQWDVLFSQNIEDLRLANERADNAERRHREIQSSTSWRIIQRSLAPYRWVRGIR